MYVEMSEIINSCEKPKWGEDFKVCCLCQWRVAFFEHYSWIGYKIWIEKEQAC